MPVLPLENHCSQCVAKMCLPYGPLVAVWGKNSIFPSYESRGLYGLKILQVHTSSTKLTLAYKL